MLQGSITGKRKMLQRPVDLKIPASGSIATKESFRSPTYISAGKPSLPSLAKCCRCNIPFDDDEVFVNIESKTWHHDCFRCTQCLCLLHDEVHYVIDGRNYCEYDFKTLYAPSCSGCGRFVLGRVIRAANTNWHPECLICNQCGKLLDSEGVWHKNDRIFCQKCNKLAKKVGKKNCTKCNGFIEHGKELCYQGAIYHPYHFCCTTCRTELDENARCMKDSMYCQQCYDRLCSICAACRHPIDNERSVCALGKHWHVDHFLCAKCEKPFYGSKFFERRGRAYCSNCYTKCFMDVCFKCNAGLTGASLKVFGKYWCQNCYACSTCDKILNQKSKVIELDMRPVCKKCFDRFPKEMKQKMMP